VRAACRLCAIDLSKTIARQKPAHGAAVKTERPEGRHGAQACQTPAPASVEERASSFCPRTCSGDM
jgi:hypothetical protein